MFEEHGAALVLFARQWCSDPDDALQEALINLANLEDEPRDCRAWLFTTVKRKAINQSRSEQRRFKYHAKAAEEKVSWFQPTPTSSLDPSDVERILSSLSALEREIVVARIWGELSFEQIANLVDRSLSVVFRHYQNALSKLGNRINGQVEKLS